MSIGRRVFHGGESQYRLNRRAALLELPALVLDILLPSQASRLLRGSSIVLETI